VLKNNDLIRSETGRNGTYHFRFPLALPIFHRVTGGLYAKNGGDVSPSCSKNIVL
jgi:hypothetical protein